jgi:hypothetical protein
MATTHGCFLLNDIITDSLFLLFIYRTRTTVQPDALLVWPVTLATAFANKKKHAHHTCHRAELRT